MRHEIETHLKREEIFEATRSFFGEADGGLGMKVSSAQFNQIAFFGDGLVWVTVLPSKDGKPTRVDIDESDREKDARKFIEQVLKKPASK